MQTTKTTTHYNTTHYNTHHQCETKTLNVTSEPIFEFRIIRVKPEFTLEFYSECTKVSKLYECFGAKTIGTWVAEAGDVGTYYTLRVWPSMSARVAARERMWNDEDFQRVYKSTFPMIRLVQSFLCHSALNMPVNMPHPDSHVVLHKMKPKKFSLFAARKYREMQTDINRIQGVENVHPIATLYPLVYNEFVMITIWEVPDEKLDAAYERLISERRNPENWEKISEYQDTFVDETRILASPVTRSHGPKF